MAIQTDPALAGLQAYADVSYADSYLGFGRLYATSWESATESTKEKALVWASRLLNDVTYRGSKADVDQFLDWPRANVQKEYTVGTPRTDANIYSETEIPELVKNAACELAMHLTETDRTLNSEENLGLSSLSVGGINLSFDHTRKAETMPKYIRDMLRPVTISGHVMRA